MIKLKHYRSSSESKINILQTEINKRSPSKDVKSIKDVNNTDEYLKLLNIISQKAEIKSDFNRIVNIC